MNERDAHEQARALGDPTRYGLFRYIVDAERPVSVGELTDFVQLNHNAVRQHLAVLKDAELVIEEIEDRDRPGRPRLLYEVHPEVAGTWGTAGPYAWLARLLGDALRRNLDPRQVGRLDGHRRAADLVGSGDAADLVEEELVRRGFRPVRTERGRRIDYVLERCPFVDVAHDDPDTVCQLHLGLAEGLTEGLGGLTLDRLVAKDARRAGCRLVVWKDPNQKLPA